MHTEHVQRSYSFACGSGETTAPHWLLTQLAMMVGFVVAWAVGGRLVRQGATPRREMA